MKAGLKLLKRQKAKNRRDRLAFVRQYADWVKRTTNKVWSKQLAKMLDG